VGLKNGQVLTYDQRNQITSRHILSSRVQHIQHTSLRSTLVLTQDGRIHRHFNGTWSSSSTKYAEANSFCEGENSLYLATEKGVFELSEGSLGNFLTVIIRSNFFSRGSHPSLRGPRQVCTIFGALSYVFPRSQYLR
jgi:hypothetical protein